MPTLRETALIVAAQALATLGTALLATTVVPHAERGLGAGSELTAVLLVAAGFGLTSVVAALKIAPVRRRSALLAAIVVLSAGLLAATVGRAMPGLATALVPVAVGFAVVTTLTLLLAGGRGGVLAVLASAGTAGAAGVAAAGALVDAGLSYRGLFAVGGFAALGAAVPVIRLGGAVSSDTLRALGGRAAAFAAVTGLLLLIALAIHGTGALEADKAAFEALHGIGTTPKVIEALFVEPNLRNYVVIVLVVGLVGARAWGRATPLRTVLLVAGAGCVAYAGVRTCWALWERPRPEEVLGVEPVNGHSWAPYPSFPSGHMAVTTALALATVSLVPRLRYVLWAYALIIAFTRLSYGAHFPSDVILGFFMGWTAAVVTVTPLGDRLSLPSAGRRRWRQPAHASAPRPGT